MVRIFDLAQGHIGVVRGPVLAGAIAEIMGPRAAHRRRQFAGAIDVGDHAFVIQIGASFAFQHNRVARGLTVFVALGQRDGQIGHTLVRIKFDQADDPPCGFALIRNTEDAVLPDSEVIKLDPFSVLFDPMQIPLTTAKRGTFRAVQLGFQVGQPLVLLVEDRIGFGIGDHKLRALGAVGASRRDAGEGKDQTGEEPDIQLAQVKLQPRKTVANAAFHQCRGRVSKDRFGIAGVALTRGLGGLVHRADAIVRSVSHA